MFGYEPYKICGAVLFALLLVTALRVGGNAVMAPEKLAENAYVSLTKDENYSMDEGEDAGEDTAPTDTADGKGDGKNGGKGKAATKVSTDTADGKGDGKNGGKGKAATKAPTNTADGKGDGKNGGKDKAATKASGKSTSQINTLLATADAGAGKKLAKKCRACHYLEQRGKSKIGPMLWNIVGAKKGGQKGFTYSKSMAKKGGAWTYDDLDAFLAAPKTYIPGTKMLFTGLKKPQDRANLIFFLRSLTDKPQPLP